MKLQLKLQLKNINLPKENEDPISTQEMISDARARRIQKNCMFKCDICDFKSTSKTLLKKHEIAIHNARCKTFFKNSY